MDNGGFGITVYVKGKIVTTYRSQCVPVAGDTLIAIRNDDVVKDRPAGGYKRVKLHVISRTIEGCACGGGSLSQSINLECTLLASNV